VGMNLGDYSTPHLFLGGWWNRSLCVVGVDGGHTRDFDLVNTVLGYDAVGEIVEI